MDNRATCSGSGRLVQLHLEDEITEKRRCFQCGVAVDVIPRKPKKGEGLTGGYVSVAILPPHRAHT